MAIEVLVVAIICYAIGSVPFAIVVARMFGNPHLSKQGSGNMGSTNVVRTTGWVAGLITLALDIAKGAVAMVVAGYLVAGGYGGYLGATEATGATGTSYGAYLATYQAGSLASLFALATILGHVRPPFRVKGGKGVAVYFGVMAVLSPTLAGLAAGCWLVVALLSNYASLASLVAVFVVALAVLSGWILSGGILSGGMLEGVLKGGQGMPGQGGMPDAPFEGLGAVLMAVVVFWTHRHNIKRLLTKTELPIISKGISKGKSKRR